MIQPSLFISHGSPMFALDPGQLGPQLTALGRRLQYPRAVLVLSPHWMSRRLMVSSAANPETLYDFSGFPRALYQLDYPAPGAPTAAREVIETLARSGYTASEELARGRDHGAWVPMMHLYPKADVPVIQLSQPKTPSPLALLELGKAVAPLRHRNVLIVGSGSLTHNLYDVGVGSATDGYARSFTAWVSSRLADGDLASLLDYRKISADARRAHPTDEHFLPLFFAIGSAGKAWTQVQRIDGGITQGVLSMDSFVFGGIANGDNRFDDVPMDSLGLDV